MTARHAEGLFAARLCSESHRLINRYHKKCKFSVMYQFERYGLKPAKTYAYIIGVTLTVSTLSLSSLGFVRFMFYR